MVYNVVDIPNEDLNENNMPGQDAPESEIMIFALTFNGYEFCGGNSSCGDLANKVAGIYKKDSQLPPLSLGELRACLFFEQRRARWTDGDYDRTEDDTRYLRTLLDTIREEISARARS